MTASFNLSPAIGRAADGQLTFWDVANGKQTGSIEGRRDIAGGRALGDKVTAANRCERDGKGLVCCSSNTQK
jgi:periodic tryptophan protein 2